MTNFDLFVCCLVVFNNFASCFRNPPYYRHKNSFHQIYQFHLEGVVLARAFVSKSELFEDKHGITQSAPTPASTSALRFLPLPIPHFKAETAQMKVWKEMENKLFICIWEETRHLSKFSPAFLWRGVSAGASKFNVLQIQTDKQTRKWADRWSEGWSDEVWPPEKVKVCLKSHTSVKNLNYDWIFIIIMATVLFFL